MRILDRYVLSGFILNYLICFVVLVGLFMIVDAFERFETMKEWGEKAAAGESPLTQLLTFYALNVPVIFVQLAPGITLMAAMFTLTRLQRSGEIVPMKASGISLYRVIAPILVAAIALAGATIAIQELVIPKVAPRLRQFHVQDVGDLEQVHASVLLDEIGTTYFIERLYPHDGRIEGIRIVERHPEPPHRKKRVIKATEARWAADGGPNRLILSDGVVDAFDPVTGLRVEGYPIVFGEEAVEFETEVVSADILFTDQQTLLSFETLAELRRQAVRHPGIAPVQVEIVSRFTRPLAHLLLLFLGLPLVLGRETRNFFLGAALAVVICGAYFFVSLYCTKLGYQAHLQPVAAAWIPVLVFGSLGAGMLDMIRT